MVLAGVGRQRRSVDHDGLADAVVELLVVDVCSGRVAGAARDADLLALLDVRPVGHGVGAEVEVVGGPPAAVVDDDVVAGAAGLRVPPGDTGGGGELWRTCGGPVGPDEVQGQADLGAVVTVGPPLPAGERSLEVRCGERGGRCRHRPDQDARRQGEQGGQDATHPAPGKPRHGDSGQGRTRLGGVVRRQPSVGARRARCGTAAEGLRPSGGGRADDDAPPGVRGGASSGGGQPARRRRPSIPLRSWTNMSCRKKWPPGRSCHSCGIPARPRAPRNSR